MKRGFKSFSHCQVDGLVALMEGEHVGPFNLGNPGEFTMLELAEVCLSILSIKELICWILPHMWIQSECLLLGLSFLIIHKRTDIFACPLVCANC